MRLSPLRSGENIVHFQAIPVKDRLISTSEIHDTKIKRQIARMNPRIIDGEYLKGRAVGFGFVKGLGRRRPPRKLVIVDHIRNPVRPERRGARHHMKMKVWCDRVAGVADKPYYLTTRYKITLFHGHAALDHVRVKGEIPVA